MFWGLKLEPGRWTPYVPPPDVHLRARVTRATLRETCEDGTRVTVKMRCETDEAVLAGALGTKGEREDGDEEMRRMSSRSWRVRARRRSRRVVRDGFGVG